MNATEIELSEDQRAAFDTFVASSTREFTLGGLAGTGKTTLVRFIKQSCEEGGVPCVILAPTAKACVALRRRGVENASTIHQAIYSFAGFERDQDAKLQMLFELKEKGQTSLGVENQRTLGDVDGPRRRGLVIVDEASMVSRQVAMDLRSRAPSILWVGDHGQLPPVGNDEGLMARLDARLERIHRQAVGSPIIELAHKVREGATMFDAAMAYRQSGAAAIAVHGAWNAYGVAQVADSWGAEVVIVARNNTRNGVNREMRKRRWASRADEPIVEGELLVGLKNNYRQQTLNGEIYRVVKVGPQITIMEGPQGMEQDALGIDVVLERDDGRRIQTVVPRMTIGRGTSGIEDRLNDLPTFVSVMDYAYALTCHKAQGSEWERVLVFDEAVDRPNWDMRRWWYTAVTRARSALAIASPRGPSNAP